MHIEGGVWLGRSVEDEFLELRLANRHGLITGATGTGKTVSLQVLAEGLSAAGVSVFAADVKGDLSGIGAVGVEKDWIARRCAEIGFTDWEPKKFPVVYWDLFGEQGHPIRATVSEMGPLLLSRLMSLNEVQEGVLNIVFKLADEENLLLIDLKDLRAVLSHVAERADELTTEYGNVSKATVGTIQRQLLVLEQQGAEKFFGETAITISDLIATDAQGRGRVNILAADKLMSSPRLYATFLLWLLSELFEELPEVGDLDRPKLVFFFDEAHLLFDEAPDALVAKVEQVARLIRSKGVGVYFVTQNPLDVPDKVSAQLGNRVQHALRAFTPREQKAVRAAAETFRQNPAFSTEKAITELAVGEALVSMLHGKGVPTMVQRTFVRPPEARVGPLTPAERATLVNTSPLAGRYDETIDGPSAYEKLRGKIVASPNQPNPPSAGEVNSGGGFFGGILDGIVSTVGGVASMRTGGPRSQTIGEAVLKSAARSAASQAGRQITNALVRGVLGSLLK
ncbi:MAG: helicase HerA-like domain-containing protein [Siculibacillus sp.]